MNTVCRDIFKAIHERKWLSIEYKNEKEEITKYWVGIISINPLERFMQVEGLHLAQYTTMKLKIYIDSILSSSVIDGSFFETDKRLVEDIKNKPSLYRSLFQNTANLKILSYLSHCNRMDCVPYKADYALVQMFDGDCVKNGSFSLSNEQFEQLVTNFQMGAKKSYSSPRMKQLALNILSIYTKRGLYVLAYKYLRLDVKNKSLRSDEDITVCTEFTINGQKQSIRKFLDAEDYDLLMDFEKNLELIKDKITLSNYQLSGVDDRPYIIGIGRDVILDLNNEYEAINKMFTEDKVSIPIKAFFGDLKMKIYLISYTAMIRIFK